MVHRPERAHIALYVLTIRARTRSYSEPREFSSTFLDDLHWLQQLVLGQRCDETATFNAALKLVCEQMHCPEAYEIWQSDSLMPSTLQ